MLAGEVMITVLDTRPLAAEHATMGTRYMLVAERMHKILRRTGAEAKARRRRTGSPNSRRRNEEMGLCTRRKQRIRSAEGI